MAINGRKVRREDYIAQGYTPTRIDVTSPEGNTLVALGLACNLLKRVGRNGEAPGLRQKVFTARSAADARQLITETTNGAITFYDPREDD